MKLKVILFLFTLAFLRADDLTTTDGTVYRDYKVISHDQGFITIMYCDGGGKIPLSQLPPSMQKQYSYDPKKAAVYVANFEAAEAAQRAAVTQAVGARLAEQEQESKAEEQEAKTYEANLALAKAYIPSATPPALTTPALTRVDIVARINQLQADINFMQREEDKLTYRTATGGGTIVGSDRVDHEYGTGGYFQMIRDETKQMNDLKARLAAMPPGNAAAATP